MNAGDGFTPREPISPSAALLEGLRANTSLRRFHLTVRPTEDCRLTPDTVAFGTVPSRSVTGTLPGGPSGSNGSGGGGGSRSLVANGIVEGAGGLVGRPVDDGGAWVAALGDALALNGTLEELTIRGDCALLVAASQALTAALITAAGLRTLSLQLLGRPCLLSKKSFPHQEVKRAETAVTAALHTSLLDGLHVGAGDAKGVSTSSGNIMATRMATADNSAATSDAMEQRAWLRLEASVVTSLCTVLLRNGLLQRLNVMLLVPGFPFLVTEESSCCDQSFGFAPMRVKTTSLEMSPPTQTEAGNDGSKVTLDADVGKDSGHGNDENETEHSLHGPCILVHEDSFEVAQVMLARAAAPSLPLRAHGVAVRLNGSPVDLPWLSEAEAIARCAALSSAAAGRAAAERTAAAAAAAAGTNSRGGMIGSHLGGDGLIARGVRKAAAGITSMFS